MLNIIKKLDKVIDDLNSIDLEHTKHNDIFLIAKEIGEIKKELVKPIEIYRNEKRFIYDAQPDYNWTTIDKNETNETNETKSKINLEKLTE